MSNGYIYILINPSLRQDYLKIGMTTKTPEERAKELSATSGVPSEYFVAYEEEVPDCELAERLIHERLSQHRPNDRREFFVLPLKKAISIIQDVSSDVRRSHNAQVLKSATSQEKAGANAHQQLFGPIQAEHRRQVSQSSLSLEQALSIELVFVQEGEFIMGSCGDSQKLPGEFTVIQEAEYNFGSESPEHRLFLKGFWISKHPVTLAQYALFAKEAGYTVRRQYLDSPFVSRKDKLDYPVVNVNWFESIHFCRWASIVTGRTVRLPTEAEWEKAARGTDGRHYPWGNSPPTADRVVALSLTWSAKPIGSKSPNGDSPYGCADMLGNIGEWCNSIGLRYPYDSSGKREVISADLVPRVTRGAPSFIDSKLFRSAYRAAQFPHIAELLRGFRVVVDA